MTDAAMPTRGVWYGMPGDTPGLIHVAHPLTPFLPCPG